MVILTSYDPSANGHGNGNGRIPEPDSAQLREAVLLDSALALARGGWKVLPVHSVAIGEVCSCADPPRREAGHAPQRV